MKQLLEHYVDLLKEYNETTNIYSKKAYDKLPFHLEDCKHLAKIITNTPLTIVDLGSGSGLPAIPLAILNPENKVIAVESKSRKTTFLEHAKKELNLNNLTIINQNAYEYFRHQRPKADIVTAKAFASLEKIKDIIKMGRQIRPKLVLPVSEAQAKRYLTFMKNPALAKIKDLSPYFYFILN